MEKRSIDHDILLLEVLAETVRVQQAEM